jgi:archaellum biogenesis protein FlaJ (TadC family)
LVSCGERSEELTRLLKLDKLVLRVTLALSVCVLALLMLGLLPRDFGLILEAVTGLPALLIGYFGLRKTKKIEVLDERFPEFITMLATSLSTLGTSLMFAFQDIARLDFGKLSSYVKRMATRLGLGISKNTSWSSFKKETSSELVRIHVDAFVEANSYGAPAKLFGPLITNSSIFLLSLRKRAGETAALMKGIVVPMHPVLCAIMGLVMAIVSTFSKLFKQFQASGIAVLFVGELSVPVISNYIYILIFALSLINAFILYEITGEQEFNMTFYTGLFIVSGWMTYYLFLTMVANYLALIGLSKIAPVPF